MPESISPLRQGIVDAAPLFVPALPFALVFGVTVSESGFAAWLGWSSSPLIFGGAAQVTLISLLGEGASVVAASTTALIIGTRHLLYSLTLAPRFAGQPGWFRWLGPYFLIDQIFALAMLRREADSRDFRHYYLATGLTFWSLWMISTAVGLYLGPVIPDHWNLYFAAPVLFMGLLVMTIDRWQKILVAALSAGLTLALADLPNRAGLLVAAMLAVAVGVLLEQFRGRQS